MSEAGKGSDRYPPGVHLLCGLSGAGKTTYARDLAAHGGAVRFSLDEWMLRLYPWRYDEPEYVAHLEPCKELIWDMAVQVLALGHDVVLDWNQWSRPRRAEWRRRAEAAGYAVKLHYLTTPLETAIRRMETRSASPVVGSHTIDPAGIGHLQSILEIPSTDEGIDIVEVRDDFTPLSVLPDIPRPCRTPSPRCDFGNR